MPRNPYPFPRLQNDSDFYGQQGKQVNFSQIFQITVVYSRAIPVSQKFQNVYLGVSVTRISFKYAELLRQQLKKKGLLL